jgi:NDP-4-keto-2,6-dideoxyhexose 3-C-methyltransferase
MLYTKISQCRICKNTDLKTILNLWEQALTGVFPLPWEPVEVGPLELVKCSGDNCCGLLQLGHDYNMEQLYGDNYGYRSWLNASMVTHLGTIAEKAKLLANLQPGDLVIDIASNDGTTLAAYGDHGYDLLWVDPTSKKFSEYYPSYVRYVSDFFSESAVRTLTDKKAKVITSMSMFYDLPDPTTFVQDVKNVLADDGIWILEQSYMPTMIDMVSYDTVCHEHLEYYALKQIKWLIDTAGMKIIDVTLNDVNGGSFQVVVSKDISRAANEENIEKLLSHEEMGGYSSGEVFGTFRENIEIHKNAVLDFFEKAKNENKKVIGYGASTKWNVTLQYCGITPEMLPYIAEVNEYKFGRTTPGTLIPLISEKEAKAMNPDYFFVLPWHFRKSILAREQKYLGNGGHFVFPLPKLEIV